MFSLRGFAVRAAVAAAVVGGTTMGWSGSASAVTCPALSASGTVTPAPTPGVNWSGCHLVGANLSGADLSGANLSATNLTGADLTGSNLSSANLANAVINNAKLADTDLNKTVMAGIFTVVDVSSGGITGTPASLPHTGFGPVELIDGYWPGPMST